MGEPSPPGAEVSRSRTGAGLFVFAASLFVLGGILFSPLPLLGGLLVAGLVAGFLESDRRWMRIWAMPLAAGFLGGALGKLLAPAYELRPPGESVVGNLGWLLPRLAEAGFYPGLVLGGGAVALFLRGRDPSGPGWMPAVLGTAVVLLGFAFLYVGIGSWVMHGYAYLYGPSPGERRARAPVSELVRLQAEHYAAHGAFATELTSFELEAPLEDVEITLEADSLSYRVTSVYRRDVAHCEASRTWQEPELPEYWWEVLRCRDLPMRRYAHLVTWRRRGGSPGPLTSVRSRPPPPPAPPADTSAPPSRP